MSQAAFQRHPYDAAQRAELARWPGVTATHEVRGKHLAVVLSFDGRSRFVIYPTTPGDTARGADMHVRDLRRELSAIGATRSEVIKAIQRRRRQPPRHARPPTIHLGPFSETRLSHDPFAALASIKFAEPSSCATATPEAVAIRQPPAPPARPTWWVRLANFFRCCA